MRKLTSWAVALAGLLVPLQGVAEPDAAAGCSLENVEKCRASSDRDCLSVIGLMCAEAGQKTLAAHDREKAKPFLNRACRLEVGSACFVLGEMELAANQRSKARVYFLSGCQFDSDKSCNALLQMGGRVQGTSY